MKEVRGMVSVFRRRAYEVPGVVGPQVRAEVVLREPVGGIGEPADVSRAVSRVCSEGERWLEQVGADLLRDIVVTVYSLEFSDDASLDGGAA